MNPRWYQLAVTGLVALMLCGCLPRRVFWSPDGQHAAIILPSDELRLCDADGKLSGVIASDVGLVAWLPDSQRFLAVVKSEAKTWEEASAVLTPERREALLKLTEPLRQEALTYSGHWNQFKPRTADQISDGELAALLLYIREYHSEGLPEKLGEKKWNEVQELTVDIYGVRAYQLSDLGAVAGTVLLRTLDEVGELRVSPDGQAVACVQTVHGSEDSDLRLSVLPVSGGALRTVSELVAAYPDWSSDGRSLVYAATRVSPRDAGSSVQLGAVTKRKVRDESGALLKEFGAPEDEVGMLFWPQMKIRCLRDGRILFSALEVNLPATKQDMPQRASLYAFDPEHRATVARLISREAESALPDGLGGGFFELSPDEKRVVVTGVKDEGMAILTLATGEVQEVQKQKDWENPGLPAWRTSEELSLFVPPGFTPGSPKRTELALWTAPGKGRCLSCDWPDLFEKKEPTAKTTTAPGNGE